ncbi:hypothetical protein GQ651_09275 [Alphaproteobacteria bacterium GH1-50]|uniref:KAP NTPase domain-containing protein n=1 Tax=Kangsaoukella pontilimi TaxID=2691042 RepID=A0A7C9MAH3_9RHOB|nr:P-loop NTPase fold protein [Kangsaoukella pontilimi]MXQ08033.1 hypothetical protein [Kangsaoukella pontilimi]
MPDFLLTVPETTIDIYSDGFQGNDALHRAPLGKKLSQLVEKVSEPMVVAVNAPWGAGKSVFLKRWVGAHTLENEGTATTVYFDAFKNDYLDDPLISLIAEVSDRLDSLSDTEEVSQLKSGIDKAKKYAPAIGRGVIKVGLALATAGIVRGIEDLEESLADDLANATSGELGATINKFWKAEESRRDAMDFFRQSLKEAATSERKLVIVVDELDRCRPDYALELLEIAKHLFDVPNVHFVLGVNLRELGNSVQARYGSGVSSHKYLQKFITVAMPLSSTGGSTGMASIQQHFRNVSISMGIQSYWKVGWIDKYLAWIDRHAELTLRDVEKIATLAVVAPEPRSETDTILHLYTGLLILQVARPDLVDRARTGTLYFEDFVRVIDFADKPGDSNPKYLPHVIWRTATWNQRTTTSTPNYIENARGNYFPGAEPREVLRQIISETLDVFNPLF